MTSHVDLTTFTRRADDRIHPTLAKIERHWQEQRLDGGIPRRRQIAPDALDDALPWSFVLHQVAPGVGRIRVAGQKLHEILRMDPRGMPLSAFFDGEDRSSLAVHLEAAFADPAIVALPLRAPATILRKEINAQLLLLPLADEAGEVTRILGGLIADGPLGARNRRLRIDDKQPIRVEQVRSLPTPVHLPNKRPNTFQHSALKLVVDNT